MADLSTDEQTVLLIAARGERLMPIGRWAAPVNSLVEKGLLVRERHAGDPTGHFNNVISPAGRTAADALDSEFDHVLSDLASPRQALASKQASQAEMTVAAQKHTRDKFRAQAEYIAGSLVELARESVAATGEDVSVALKNWTKAIVKRAREMVG